MTAAAFVLGLLVGSFLNVCIYRWPLGQSVASPRSHCTDCGHQIAWHDNIPLLSYAVLRGRCRECDARISLRYPSVELLTAVIFSLVVIECGIGIAAAKAAVFSAMCLVLFFTDKEHFILPDEVTFPGLAAGIAFSFFVPLRPGVAQGMFDLSGWYPPAWSISAAESLLGAALFGGILFLTGEAFYRMRSVEGLGFGDVKLVAMIGAFQGSAEALLVLLLACLLASAYGLAGVLARKRAWRTPLPLGSYLSFAAIVSMFSADVILNRYWEFVLG